MLTLHHLENSRSFRILWLLEELQLDYELQQYRRDPDSGMAQTDLKSKHALGKAPLLEDEGRQIAESGAIIEYLLDHYGDKAAEPLRPEARSDERIRYNFWLHAAEGTYMNLLLLTLFMNRMESRSPLLIRPIVRMVTGKVRQSYLQPNMQRAIAHVESELAARPWFAGEQFSAADIQMGFVMTALAARGGLDEGFPACQRWQQQVEQRPAWQRAMEKNGPMQLLGS